MKSYNYDLAPGPTANTTAATGGTTSPASSTGELFEQAVMEPALDVPLPTEPAPPDAPSIDVPSPSSA